MRTHPETGRKALYVNVAHTARFVDMTEEESRPLLQYLFEHSVRPEFTCRFRWQVGSLALWDNRCAMHNPINDYHGYTRAMHRITLAGDVPPMDARAQRGHVADDSRRWCATPRDRLGDGATRSSTATGASTTPTCATWSTTPPRALIAAGIEPGDRVAVWAPNSLEWIVAALGVTTAGGVLVPVNTRFKGAEAAYVLARSGARVAVHRARVPRHRLPRAAREAGVDAPVARAHDPARGRARRRRAIAWDEFLARGTAVPDADARRARRGARRPTTRATSCSRRGRPATPRAS